MVSLQTARVIPFPEHRRRSTAFRRQELRSELERSFLSQSRDINDLDLIDLRSIESAFFAVRRLDHCPESKAANLARIYSCLPGTDHVGSHEFKLIGGEHVEFFTFELHEPETVRTSRTLGELDRIAEQRLAALHRFRGMDAKSPLMNEIFSLIGDLAFHRNIFEKATYMRWIGATKRDADNPAVMATLEMEIGPEETRVSHNMHPYLTQRSFLLPTKQMVRGVSGQVLMAEICTDFLAGHGRFAHLRISTDPRVTAVEESEEGVG